MVGLGIEDGLWGNKERGLGRCRWWWGAVRQVAEDVGAGRRGTGSTK